MQRAFKLLCVPKMLVESLCLLTGFFKYDYDVMTVSTNV